jgi:beta-lactamase class A
MDRLTPKLKVKLDRVDVMLGCALAVVVGSYTLGYRLDWSQLDQASEAQATVASAPGGGALAEGLSKAAEKPPMAPVESMAPASVPPAELKPAPAPGAPAQAVIAPDPKEADWEFMTQELSRHASKYRGHVAIFLKDMKSGRTWTYHPDDLFPAASLIKVPVMICVFEKIHDGEVALSDQLTLRRHNRVGGSGSLKWRPDGSKFTVRELLQHMISESDNTATNMLIELVGMGYLQQEFPKIGLLYTGIYPDGMSLKSSRVAHENYTTAREMTMMLDKIYHGEYIDTHASALMLDILKHKKAVASRLAKGLPRGWEIAHKTGLLRMACHDSAIIFSPEGDYAITVLTGQNPDYHSAKDFITGLARITFRHYGGMPHYYARASRRHFAVR